MASRPEELYSSMDNWTGKLPTSLQVADRYCPIQQYLVAQTPPQREWETGLKSDLKVILTPDHRDQISPGLISFVESLKQIELLKPNWDSYQANPLDIRVERPALELAILSNARCNYPSVTALPTGGLSLRWTSDVAVLEIDIHPSGSCEALLELTVQDEEIELPLGSTLGATKNLLNQFNSAS
jgi:hypothetical protein